MEARSGGRLRLGDSVAFGAAISLDQVKPFVLGHVGRPFAVWVEREKRETGHDGQTGPARKPRL